MNAFHLSISGLGAVSSAGWGVDVLRRAVMDSAAPPIHTTERENSGTTTRTRPVPKPETPLAFLRNARLRRCSPITRFCVAASLQALGEARIERIQQGDYRLGILFVFMNGCVNYSNRFFGEVLNDPSLASPILFPETVFNAPASHLAAMLKSTGPASTLIGDSAHFLSGVRVGIEWLLDDAVDGVVVTGGEELDWLSAEAALLFARQTITSEGAGALLLEKSARLPDGPTIHSLTPAFTYGPECPRPRAVRQVSEALAENQNPDHGEPLVTIGHHGAHDPAQWQFSPDQVLGDSLGAALALQCVLAASLLEHTETAHAQVLHEGTNLQAMGAHFARFPSKP